MLGSRSVLNAMVHAFDKSDEEFEARLIEALKAANGAGGDFRGLLSAAILVLHPDRAPLSLRIDYHPDDPIGALEQLLAAATSGDYADWSKQVPVASDKERIID